MSPQPGRGSLDVPSLNPSVDSHSKTRTGATPTVGAQRVPPALGRDAYVPAARNDGEDFNEFGNVCSISLTLLRDLKST